MFAPKIDLTRQGRSHNPEAHVAVQKNRVKNYNQNVYLEDGQEFQLELFNPLTKTVGLSLTFNDGEESAELLVLHPGQRFYLDRFLSEDKKLKFSTYKVEANNSIVEEAIKKNGLITINWFLEEEPRRFSSPTLYKGLQRVNNTRFDNSNFVEYKAESNMRLNFLDVEMSREKETGKIDIGNQSEQSFVHVNKKFYSFPFHVTKIHILPLSEKPISTNEIVKKYCSNCGAKIKTTDKFCFNCGVKL